MPPPLPTRHYGRRAAVPRCCCLAVYNSNETGSPFAVNGNVQSVLLPNARDNGCVFGGPSSSAKTCANSRYCCQPQCTSLPANCSAAVPLTPVRQPQPPPPQRTRVPLPQPAPPVPIELGYAPDEAVLFEGESEHGCFRRAVPSMPMCVAVVLCIINFILPGVGELLRSFVVLNGHLQLTGDAPPAVKYFTSTYV